MRRGAVLAALLLLLAAAAPARAPRPSDRLREVVDAVHRYFLYPVRDDESYDAAFIGMGCGVPEGMPGWDGLGSALDDFSSRYPNRAEAIYRGAVEAYTESLGDPYTTWLSPEERRAEEAEMSNRSFSGIGVEVAPDPLGLKIVAALVGSPARAAGLRPGDRILAADSHPLRGLGYYRAADRLVGAVGSAVRLRVQGRGGIRRVRMTRGRLRLPPVQGRLLDASGGIAAPGSGETCVGYLRISIFGPDTARQAWTGFQALARAGASAFILDLRDNPGGDLRNALTLASLLAPGRVLVEVQRRTGPPEKRIAPGTPLAATAPMIVLVDAGTASSSEVVAGCLDDYHIATLMGQRTFGKGLIQTEVPLRDGAELKVTSARYRTPTGRDINGKGLAPEIPAPVENNGIILSAVRYLVRKSGGPGSGKTRWCPAATRPARRWSRRPRRARPACCTG